MLKGKARKVFPGNNTSKGFFSFYENIIKPDATRIFVIKGGPGVGKSTFMTNIGNTMLEKGFDVELHYCSSDNDSLDAVVVPALQVALLDGTAPHIVDPKNPGAVDEIINLGDYWDEAALVSNKGKIIACNKRISRFFKTAYSYLKEAKIASDELAGYFSEAMNHTKLQKNIHMLCTEIFYNLLPDYKKPAGLRRLFASANTPDGLVNYIDTILQDTRKLYMIKGEPAAGKDELLQAVLDKGVQLGVAVEAYHCPFEPEKLELLYFPELFTGVLYQNDRLDFDPGVLQWLDSLEILDLNQHLDAAVCGEYSEEIQDAKNRMTGNIKRAYQKLNAAKKMHDEMEMFYVPAMNFKAVNKKREEVLERILVYSQANAG